MTIAGLPETSSVYPFGSDLTTLSAPMAPAAPGLLSITTDCPVRSCSFCANTRAKKSVVAPAEELTTMQIVFDGYSCADAGNDIAAVNTARPMLPAIAPCNFIRTRCSIFPSSLVMCDVQKS